MLFKKNDSIELDNIIMKRNKVPILIQDANWKKIFSNNMNKPISTLSKQLNELLVEEKELQKKLQLSLEKKRVLMNKIIHLSDRLNRKGEEIAIDNMEDIKNQINNLNEEIDKIRENLEIYPEKIYNLNMELLKETTKITYSEINDTEHRLTSVDNEINTLREKLGQCWDEKESLEGKVQVLYSLLHSIIGPEEMEKLDIKFCKNK